MHPLTIVNKNDRVFQGPGENFVLHWWEDFFLETVAVPTSQETCLQKYDQRQIFAAGKFSCPRGILFECVTQQQQESRYCV